MKKRKMKWRFTILIYPKFQLTLLLANILILGSTIAFIWVQLDRSFIYLKEISYRVNGTYNNPFNHLLDVQFGQILSYLSYAFIGSALISSILTLVLSHKISGPIVRVIRYLRDVSKKGVSKPLAFRKRDFFKELPVEINKCLKKLKAQI